MRRLHALLIALALAGPAVRAQDLETDGTFQLGAGLLPGLGAQVGYLRPGAFFVTEGMVFVDGVPGFLGGEGNVQVSLGAGGALRTLGVARLFSEERFLGYDVDFGARFGPALTFRTTETRAERNQRFSLFFDPYLRFVSRFNDRFVVYAEAGAQRPLVRGGVWVTF